MLCPESENEPPREHDTSYRLKCTGVERDGQERNGGLNSDEKPSEVVGQALVSVMQVQGRREEMECSEKQMGDKQGADQIREVKGDKNHAEKIFVDGEAIINSGIWGRAAQGEGSVGNQPKLLTEAFKIDERLQEQGGHITKSLDEACLLNKESLYVNDCQVLMSMDRSSGEPGLETMVFSKVSNIVPQGIVPES